MTEEARPRSARVRLCVGERASSVFDDDRATLPEEQLQAEEDAQFEAVSAATVGPLTSAEDKILFVREKKLLDEMTKIAEAARGLPDARVRRLVQWIREKMCTPLESRLPRAQHDALLRR